VHLLPNCFEFCRTSASSVNALKAFLVKDARMGYKFNMVNIAELLLILSFLIRRMPHFGDLNRAVAESSLKFI
jgi:hypothetical protein